MAGYPPPSYPPPPSGDWRYQRKLLREQARMQQEVLRAQRVAYRRQLRGQSRGSIVGPLLVVAVGLLFLLVQLGRLSATRVWEWYGRWWPLFLVGVGVLLLAEWGLDQLGTATAQRRSLGSGVVILLVLLALTGITVNADRRSGSGFFIQGLHLDPDNLNEFMGDKHESDDSSSQPLAPGGSISVENPHGDLTISGTSGDGQVHLLLHREIYSRSDDEASRKAQQLVPNVTQTGNGLSISIPVIDGARADLSLIVPAATAQTLTVDHGDLHVSSVRAGLTILANHGDVSLSAITGPVTTHINNEESSFAAHNITGAISLAGKGHDITISDIDGAISMSGDFFGETHLEHVSGTVTFRTTRTDLQLGRVAGEVDISSHADLSASEIVGPVVLNTRNRNVTMDRVSGDLSVVDRNGSVDLTSAPPLGNVTVENRNGSVHVTLPTGVGFVTQADTTDGELQNDFSLPVQSQESRESVNGTVGQGGPTVRISTTQGDISLKRGDEAPVPSSSPKLTLIPAIPASPHAESARDSRQAAKEVADAKRQAKAARILSDEAKKQQTSQSDDSDPDE